MEEQKQETLHDGNSELAERMSNEFLGSVNSEKFTNTISVPEMELVSPISIEGCYCEDIFPDEVEEVYALAAEMIKFCVSKNGIGLAAPQIGIPKKFFVWLDGDKWSLSINPKYFPDGNKKVDLFERCLSYKEPYKVNRFKAITGVYYTIDGNSGELMKVSRKLSKDKAWVFQHETDHLFGKTIRTEGISLHKKEILHR